MIFGALSVQRAIADTERWFGKLKIKLDAEALVLWATMSDCDARRALMALEVAVLSLRSEIAGAEELLITLDVAEQSRQRKAIVYDSTGDEHYDAASALIKSMRGSDPDAAIYWVARMLEAGEDPRFIARRDRDSRQRRHRKCRSQMHFSCCQCRRVCGCRADQGMPGRLSQLLVCAAIYMATAPKSNASAKAIWGAMSDVREGRTILVPKHLKDTH